MYAADVSFMSDSCMWTTDMSLVIERLRVGDSDANGASAKETRVDLAANRGLMIDLLVFLL